VQGPEGSAFRIEAAAFQGSLDCSVSRMDLRGESSDTFAVGVRNKSLQQRPADATVTPGVLDEHFDEVHRLPTIFGSPFVAGIGKPADARLILGHKDDSELWSVQHPFIDPLGVTRRSPRIPFVQQFFGKFAHPWNIARARGPDLNRRCL
jgi:hypothetical protein